MRQVEAYRAGGRPLAYDDVEGEILHRRVEHLFHGAVQAVNLVDEEDVAFLEVGEYGGQIAGTLDGRPARGLEGDAHLVGYHAGKRGLAQARRPGEKQVVEGLAARFGGLDQDGEVFLDARLAEVLGQGLRAQPRLGGGLLACLRR